VLARAKTTTVVSLYQSGCRPYLLSYHTYNSLTPLLTLPLLKMLDDCIIKAMRDGTSRLASVRLLVLGASTRGKTSTVASLRRHAFEENRLSTHGIKLHICYVVPGRQDVDGHLEGKAGDGKLEMTLRARDMFQEKLRQYLQY